jgi:hypothetical protein
MTAFVGNMSRLRITAAVVAATLKIPRSAEVRETRLRCSAGSNR